MLCPVLVVVPAVLCPCRARFPTCCVPAALCPLGTLFQMELRTPSDWPFLGAWRYFPSGPTSLPVEESAVGAGPERPLPPPPVTCPQAPSHRNNCSPRPAWHGTGLLAPSVRCENHRGWFSLRPRVPARYKKLKLPLDPGKASRALGTPKVCPKSFFMAVHPRWGQPGHGLLGFLDPTMRKTGKIRSEENKNHSGRQWPAESTRTQIYLGLHSPWSPKKLLG